MKLGLVLLFLLACNIEGAVQPRSCTDKVAFSLARSIRPSLRFAYNGPLWLAPQGSEAVLRDLLRDAARTGKPSADEILGALGEIDNQNNFDVLDMNKLEGRWRLVASSGNPKESIPRGYFPGWLAGLQSFDQSSRRMSNAISLLFLLQIVFSGPYREEGNKVLFMFDRVKIGLLPAFKLKKSSPGASAGGGTGGGEGEDGEDKEEKAPSALQFMVIEKDIYAWKGSTGYGLYRRARGKREWLCRVVKKALGRGNG